MFIRNACKISLSGLKLPLMCTCSKRGIYYFYIFVCFCLFVFNDLMLEIVVYFVDIGSVVDHQYLSFSFKMNHDSFKYQLIYFLIIKMQIFKLVQMTSLWNNNKTFNDDFIKTCDKITTKYDNFM